MKDLLDYIIQGITQSKNYEISENSDGNYIRYDVYADPSIMGIIIGKEGRIVKSIRNILKIRATKEQKAVSVNIFEKTS